ncbi:MAG: MBL fold metallo-hydrolase [Akkermansiaceae bacterium]
MQNSTRRQFLSLSSIAATTGLISAPTLLAKETPPAKEKNLPPNLKTTPKTNQRNPYVYHFKIGNIDAWSISDGYMKIGQGINLMYPESQRENMAQTLKDHSEPLDHIPLYVNILLIKVGTEFALFDAGFGGPEKNNRGWLTPGLASIGITPDQITHTFLSHCHSDHIAGFTTNGKPTFPNAALNITPEEYNYWRSPSPDFSNTKRNPKQIPGMVKQAKKHLEILTPNAQLTPVGSTHLNNTITIENGFGHTPGHAIYRIRCQETNEELLHTVDLAHNHLLMFQNPTWKIGWDNNLELAAQTRNRIFTQAAHQKTRTFGFHLPFPGLGRITPLNNQPKGFTWTPERLMW